MRFVDLASPFAVFENGDTYVLPNVLPELARSCFERLQEEAADSVIASLHSLGRQQLFHNTSVKDLERVWDTFLAYYLTQVGPDTPSTDSRIDMMQLMLSGPPAEAWNALRARILADIDDISGWSVSFQKILSERDQIWRGEDGNYYHEDSDGTIYQVIGGRTIAETRIDFLTDQIVRQFGNVRMFLQLFSWIAIAKDYIEHADSYHNSMKALIQERKWPSLNHRWTLLQWHASRTVIWRPWSNLCDPQWLAGDLLAVITDSLKAEPYQPARIPAGNRSELGPEYVRQADFVVDTQLRFGEEEAVVLTFAGREFRWINASLESETRISVGLKEAEDQRVPEEELNRFLSILAWEHNVPISKKNGPIIGQRRALPHILSPRSIFSLLVDSRNPLTAKLNLMGEKEKLALSIYREAANARSVFYSFLSYWKVIEVIFPQKDQRHDWVDQAASRLSMEKERVAAILKTNPHVSEYLDYHCRSAVVHVFRKPFVDPDSSDDFVRLSLDLPIVRSLAKVAMRTLPAFS